MKYDAMQVTQDDWFFFSWELKIEANVIKRSRIRNQPKNKKRIIPSNGMSESLKCQFHLKNNE